jgi:hypothetical protein
VKLRFGSDASLARPQAKPGPSFSIAIQLPDGNRSSHTIKALGASLKWVVYVKAHKYTGESNAQQACAMTESKGVESGCEIFAGGTQAYDLRTGTFELYSKSAAKGCLLASGKFSGTVTPTYQVAIPFKALNVKTKGCWK